MRDPERIPLVLAALERAWREEPDQRFGQFIHNLLRRNWTGDDYLRVLSHIEDGELLKVLGVETEQEKDYVRRESGDRDRGWDEWMREHGQRITDWQKEQSMKPSRTPDEHTSNG